MSRRRKGLRKQVTKRGKENVPGGGGGKSMGMLHRKSHNGSSVLRVFQGAGILGEVPGEDLNRLFISFPGVSFRDHGLH